MNVEFSGREGAQTACGVTADDILEQYGYLPGKGGGGGGGEGSDRGRDNTDDARGSRVRGGTARSKSERGGGERSRKKAKVPVSEIKVPSRPKPRTYMDYVNFFRNPLKYGDGVTAEQALSQGHRAGGEGADRGRVQPSAPQTKPNVETGTGGAPKIPPPPTAPTIPKPPPFPSIPNMFGKFMGSFRPQYTPFDFANAAEFYNPSKNQMAKINAPEVGADTKSVTPNRLLSRTGFESVTAPNPEMPWHKLGATLGIRSRLRNRNR